MFPVFYSVSSLFGHGLCVFVCAQVGREDSGKPLWFFREVLSLPVEQEQPLPFFFHAGETGESVFMFRRYWIIRGIKLCLKHLPYFLLII